MYLYAIDLLKFSWFILKFNAGIILLFLQSLFKISFQRNMREAHAMYPFTGKRDKELFEKALAEVSSR